MARTVEKNCLIITFARHSHLDEIINAVKPHCKRIFIYQNVATPKLRDNCARVRNIIKMHEDSNQVIYFQPPRHLESEKSITFAITKFFSEVEFGTIFEDDCIPSEKLWNAIDALVESKNIENEFVFNGFTPVSYNSPVCSLTKKRYLHVWGWTSNRETWNNFRKRYDISNLSVSKLLRIGLNFKSSLYWYFLLRMVQYGKIKTWDYKFLYYLWMNSIPIFGVSKNLVKNMGADELSVFMRKDETGVSRIKIADDIQSFKLDFDTVDKSEDITNRLHYDINWKRIIVLLLLNIKRLVKI